MANDISAFSGLVNQLVADGIPLQRPAMPPVNLYCTPLRLAGPVVAGKAAVPVVTSVQAVVTNPTGYESQGDTLGIANPTLVHYSAQFGFSNPDQAKGLDIRMVLQSHLTTIEQKIQSAINAVITEANFSSAVATVVSGSWAVANLETLMAACPARSIVALTPAYFVKTKSTWMPAGAEGTLKEFSDVTSVGANITGFAARPEAVALVYGYPYPGSREVETSFIKLPNGLDVQFCRHFSLGGRRWSASLDICLAPSVGQAGALKILKSA